jgi:ABC-2 type transport system ATP-binding protein
VPAGLDAWPAIASVRTNGSLVEIIARAWTSELPARLATKGLLVQRTDPMGLEDIFVTAVRSGAVA